MKCSFVSRLFQTEYAQTKKLNKLKINYESPEPKKSILNWSMVHGKKDIDENKTLSEIYGTIPRQKRLKFWKNFWDYLSILLNEN